METSPLTTVATGGREKLSALVEAGVNRFSIGVQTFDEKLLRRTRGHGLQEAREAVAILADFDVKFNVDMIQDLPHQTDESLICDLNWIDEFRPHQVTWYVLRMHPESPWHQMYARGDLELPAPFESVRRRLLLQEGMRRIGYSMQPGGRFVRTSAIHDRFKEVRAGTDPTLLGIGVSAYSHGWGYFFRNSFATPMNAGIRGYVERIRRGGLAVESGLRLDPSEVVAGRIVAGIRSGVRLPDPELGTESYVAEATARLLALRDAALVEITASETWSLTDRGRLFEEEICSLFYSTSVKQVLTETGNYWAEAPMAFPGIASGISESAASSVGQLKSRKREASA